MNRRKSVEERLDDCRDGFIAEDAAMFPQIKRFTDDGRPYIPTSYI